MDLSDYDVIMLETFRQNGEAVPAPVWFVQEGNTLYLVSQANAGKMKRIRQNPKVRVAGCDKRERPVTEWIDGTARLLDTAEAEKGLRLLAERYNIDQYDEGEIGYAIDLV
jgi:uncharacterized protein